MHLSRVTAIPRTTTATSLNTNDKIYVAGHGGMVGSAIVRVLQGQGYTNLLLRSRTELDLTDQSAVGAFFEAERPDYVFLAAAKVGGISANDNYPADFIGENLSIELNVINQSSRCGVKRLLFLGSSCIYPKHAPQPLREEYLLTGPLESTNRAYALAKICGVELCWSYNRQFGTRFVGAMPTNLYGLGDNYDLENSHVIPALIRKFHHATVVGLPEVVVWGTGKPRREFLISDDAADACVFIMNLPDSRFETLLGNDRDGAFEPPLLNVGTGEDLEIGELAELIKDVVGYRGEIVFDTSKPDGTPAKRLDVSRLTDLGWRYRTRLRDGLALVYERDLDRIEGR